MSQTVGKKPGVSTQPSTEPPTMRSPAPPVEQPEIKQSIDSAQPSAGSAAESARVDKNVTDEDVTVDEETIRQLAYQRWEAAGRPDGSDVNFWLEAERDLH